MSHQLSSQEIEKLFVFVESKNVYWKDVQYEIVDHLATEIEERMTENPKMSFNIALDEVYGKFPITGFAQIVNSQEKVLKKYWIRKSWKLVLEYFKLPKLVMTLSILAIMYSLVNQFPETSIYIIYAFTSLCVLIGYFIKKRRGDFDKNNPINQLMLTKAMRRISDFINIQILIMPLYAFGSIGKDSYLSYITLYFTVFYLGLILMWSHAQIFRIPELIKETYKKKYSHLNIKLS